MSVHCPTLQFNQNIKYALCFNFTFLHLSQSQTKFCVHFSLSLLLSTLYILTDWLFLPQSHSPLSKWQVSVVNFTHFCQNTKFQLSNFFNVTCIMASTILIVPQPSDYCEIYSAVNFWCQNLLLSHYQTADFAALNCKIDNIGLQTDCRSLDRDNILYPTLCTKGYSVTYGKVTW